jgi:D-threo-aldose 1-dehydrogenase
MIFPDCGIGEDGVKVTHRRAVGETGLELTALGMGCASLGGLYAPVDAETCMATCRRRRMPA